MIELWVFTFSLILVRVATFVAVLPIFGRGTIPRTVLIGLSLSLTTLWFFNMDKPPEHLMQHQGSVSMVGFCFATMAEVITGTALALAFGILIFPARIAGSYLAQEMGLSIATLSDPSSTVNSDVLSSLFQTLGLILFFMLDLHHFLFAVLDASFVRLPVGQMMSFESLEVGIDALCRVDQWGLAMIAPVGICLFVILIVLLLLTKTSPTMNIFSVGLTIRVGAGLFFLMLFAPNIIAATKDYFEHGKSWILGFMGEM